MSELVKTTPNNILCQGYVTTVLYFSVEGYELIVRLEDPGYRGRADAGGHCRK